MPDFTLNQRVRNDNGEEGIVIGVHDFVDIRMDSGREAHCQTDGSSCCSFGRFQPISATPEGSKFTVGQRCAYYSDGYRYLCTVSEITDSYIRAVLDSHDNWAEGTTKSFNTQGNGRSREADAATSFGCLVPVIEPLFPEGDRVAYHMSSTDSAAGTVEKTDELYIYVKLDDDQTHVRYVDRVRIFNLDGTGTGTVYNIPPDTRCTELSSRLGRALPKWQPTPGREYPEEPRVGYGVFDTYYGRPLEKDNPGGYEPRIGWGVINPPADVNFSQVIFDEESGPVRNGYLTNARNTWKNICLDIDLAAIENPLELLKGCEIYSMWLHADTFGCEFFFPETLTLRNRRRLVFGYPRACCTAGLVTMDELNLWFQKHMGSMRIIDVDGTKITMQGKDHETIEFHVLPKLFENFKPTITAPDVKAKELLLQNLAMQSESRDSTLAEAA